MSDPISIKQHADACYAVFVLIANCKAEILYYDAHNPEGDDAVKAYAIATMRNKLHALQMIRQQLHGFYVEEVNASKE